jgi:hypothetical protein
VPIRPENRDRYPDDWTAISLAVRTAAGWRCQCDGRCGQRRQHLATDERCPASRGHLTRNGKPIVLTVAHLNHIPEDCDPSNLMAMCQACHFNYDIHHHAETRAATREAALAATMDHLFELEPPT